MQESQHSSLINTVRAVLPMPVKVAMRPAVKAIAPGLLTQPAEPKEVRRSGRGIDNESMSFCDRPTANRWTVHNPATGLEHKFFFLAGCGKSGTHWIQKILNLHPQVKIKGEYHFEQLLTAMDRFTGHKWCIGSKPRGKLVANVAFENMVRRVIYATTRECPNALWLGDRSPRPLREIIPGAPIYWILRDGRDVLVSWLFHWLRIDAKGAPFIQDVLDRCRPEFATNPDRFRDPDYGLLGNDAWVRQTARQWAEYVASDIEALPRLLARGTPVHKVVYEDLHQSPHDGAEAIYRFLNLDPTKAEPLSVETETLPGFKQEDLKSAKRKGQIGDWRNYFNDRITRIFKEEAGQVLVQTGYERDLNW